MYKPVRCLLVLGLLNQLFIACKKDDEQEVTPANPLTVTELTGYVQKGPFVIGTTITVSELDKNLSQTGKSFNASIQDDQGSFTIKNLKLASKYVELRANGFYFNEVTGRLSASQLTLTGVADVAERTSFNVNLLTHLEKTRVEYLMNNGKKSFAEAKRQAQREVLALFSITKNDIATSERLNISQAGEDNAILLAISAIMQADKSESELSELLSKISLDIQQDGTLDNTSLQSALVNQATLLDRSAIRTNMTKRYNELGLTVVVGDFEKYVQLFIDKTAFAFTKKIHYPASGANGVNMLTDTVKTIILAKARHNTYAYPQYANSFSLAATPPTGTKVRVKLVTVRGTNDSYTYIKLEAGSTWREISKTNNVIEYEATGGGEPADGKITAQIHGADTLHRRIEVYENNATTPTHVRDITLLGDCSLPASVTQLEYPAKQYDVTYNNYYSIGNMLDTETYQYYGNRNFLVLVPRGNKVRVRLSAVPGMMEPALNNYWQQLSHTKNETSETWEYETKYDNVAAFLNFSTLNYMWDDAKVEIYENGASTPTRTKEIKLH